MESGFSTVDFQCIACIDFSVSKLAKPVDYISKAGTRYRIPYGQGTDFASIPSALWGAPLFLIPYGWYSLPAMLHDSGFRNNLLIVNADSTISLAALSESQCNDLLLEAMRSLKPNPGALESMQMHAIFEGVALFGFNAYRSDRS